MTKINQKEILIVAGIIMAAAAVRLIALFHFGTYNFDNLFSVHFSSLGLDKMFWLLKDEMHPPLYYFLLHFWIKIFGSNELITPLPSIIFSLATIPLLYSLTKKILNRPIAYLTIIIYSFSYFQIFTAVEVRMFSLLLLLGVASLLLFWQVIIEKKKQFWPLYLAVTAAMTLVDLGGVFALASQWLWLLILIRYRKIEPPAIKKFLVCQGLVIVTWLTWLVPAFLSKLPLVFTKGWYFQPEVNNSIWVGIYDYFFMLLKVYWLRFFTGVIVVLAPFFILLWPEKKTIIKTAGGINANWFLFALVAPGFITSLIVGINLPRIFIIAFLGFYLITAYFFWIIYHCYKKTFWVLIIIWFFITGFNLVDNLFGNIIRWDLANQWLTGRQQAGDKILLISFINQLPFERYYTGQTPWQGFYPLDDNLTFEQRVVQKNWQQLVTAQNVERLDQLTADAKRLVIIFETTIVNNNYTGPVPDWLNQNGWHLAQEYKPDSFAGPQILVWEK